MRQALFLFLSVQLLSSLLVGDVVSTYCHSEIKIDDGDSDGVGDGDAVCRYSGLNDPDLSR